MNAALSQARFAIQQDCENDAAGLDGQEFNGRTVATQLGQTLAMVSAVAHVVDDLVAFLDRELS